jgi:FkbH-like protein
MIRPINGGGSILRALNNIRHLVRETRYALSGKRTRELRPGPPELLNLPALSNDFVVGDSHRAASQLMPDDLLVERNNGPLFRVPEDLKLTPTKLRRMLVVGSCMSEHWAYIIPRLEDGCECDHVLFNHVALPEQPPRDISNYDVQLIQLPLRAIIPEQLYFGLPFADPDASRRAFETASERLSQFLDAALGWAKQHHILTFVTNFMLPQQNPMGRLLPRNDFRNMVYFVDQLNTRLADKISECANTYVLDVDQIAASIGRKHVQDDSVYQLNHGTGLGNYDFPLDRERLEPPPKLTEMYRLRTREFSLAVWAELCALYRTHRQLDQVKLVVVDLDDTLWRGVVAENDDVRPETIEGWPLGLIEALNWLKQRGVLLAIVSRNDDARITGMWDRIMGRRLALSDFAVRRINWQSKAENLGEVMRAVNVLPHSVVFIDDNPVERAAIKAAFPDVRVLGAHVYWLRKILLWAPEIQVARVSAESARRTEMVQAQIERELERARMSRADFLESLKLRVRVTELKSGAGSAARRTLELVNKTNQFNTTGRRWSEAELIVALASGTTFHVFDVVDRFTEYGLVGVVVTRGQCIEQFVMSCRVLGMDVELAALAHIVSRMARESAAPLNALIRRTDVNTPCWRLFERFGFVEMAEGWIEPADFKPPSFDHIQISST